MLTIVFVSIFSALFRRGLCYPSGAPVSQCGNMVPNHGVSGQTGPSPYKIKINQSYYMAGQNVNVSIESSGTANIIRGYLIQARMKGSSAATGMWKMPPRNGKYLSCGNDQGSVTHSTRLNVTSVNFQWQSSEGLSGNITFFATVVKNGTIFWVKLESPEIYKREINATQRLTMATSSMAPTTNSNKRDPTSHATRMTDAEFKLIFLAFIILLQNYI